MSIHWMNYAWSDDGPQGHVDRYVFLKLADNADQDGNCFPSISEIVAKTHLSESTVKRAIRQLEGSGYLRVVEVGTGKLLPPTNRFSSVRKRHTSHYQLCELRNPKWGSQRTPSSVNGVQPDQKRGSERTPSGVQRRKSPTPPILRTVINHQGTKNPPPPSPPASGRGGGLESRPDANGNGHDKHDHAADAVDDLMRECGFTNHRARRWLADTLAARMRQAMLTAYDASDEMRSAWKHFQDLGPLIRVRWGPRRFFTEGHWLKPDTWQLDREELSRRRLH